MGGVGTQGPTQTIINAVQKGIFVFKSLSIKADRGHIAHFLLGRLLRGCPSPEYITNDEMEISHFGSQLNLASPGQSVIFQWFTEFGPNILTLPGHFVK